MVDVKSVFIQRNQMRRILEHPEFLTDSYIPDKLLFRDEEISEISRHAADFLFSKLLNNIIVHGQAGVGKTAAVLYITRVYNEIADEKEINSRAIYLSLKDLTYRQALYELARQLNIFVRQGYSVAEIYKRIVQYLSATDAHYLFVVDEIDKMKRRYGENTIDDLIYSLSRINERVGKVSVMNIFVTNNARIVETLSAPSLSSLSPVFIYFRNYNANELYEILKDRVEKAFVENAVDDAALRLLAALIIREGRDLRWAFAVLREAAAIVNDRITEDTIHEAIDIVERNVLEKVVTGLDVDSVLTLLAIALLSEEVQTIDSSKVYMKYKELTERFGWYAKTMRHVVNVITAKLENEGLITRRVVSRGRYGRTHVFQLQESAFRVRELCLKALKSRLQT